MQFDVIRLDGNCTPAQSAKDWQSGRASGETYVRTAPGVVPHRHGKLFSATHSFRAAVAWEDEIAGRDVAADFLSDLICETVEQRYSCHACRETIVEREI